MTAILHSTRIVTEQGIREGWLEIEAGRIRCISDHPLPGEIVDVGSDRIIPGIIDIHNHGYGGWSMTDPAQVSDVEGFARAVASIGVTCVLPTAKESAFEAIAQCVGKELDGAWIFGIHSEGPFWARGGENTVGEEYPLPDVEDVIKGQQLRASAPAGGQGNHGGQGYGKGQGYRKTR